MAGKGPRYRFVLVEEPETTLPNHYHRSRPAVTFFMKRTDPLETLFEALLMLNRRSEGARAWAPVLSDNPLVFLLDAMQDAVFLRNHSGKMVYANPAARRLSRHQELVEILTARPYTALETLELAEGLFERRCMEFGYGSQTVVLEVLCRMNG